MSRGYLIIRTAHELGCDTFVHISFPRHLAYETMSRRVAIMKAACEEFGMSFEMEKYMKRVNPEFAYNVGRVLELNPEHEAVKTLQRVMTEDPVLAKDYAQLLCCQAQLMAQLPLDDPFAYSELVCRLMK